MRDFLVSRRGRVRPEEAGVYVPAGTVRRVPGLRREEVASLAGVSVDYYTQLERGDIDGASDSVLAAIARALRLDEAERLHLFDLARAGPPPSSPSAPATAIRPPLQRTLDAFGGMALVRNRRWDYLASNALARAVYAPIFDTPTGDPPNHIRFTFLDARARDFADDWGAVARDSLRVLRSEAARDPQDPGAAELIQEMLDRSAEFRAMWAEQDVRLPAAGLHRFRHPRAGLLELAFEAATLRADPGLTLLLATAEPGSPTEAALNQLASR